MARIVLFHGMTGTPGELAGLAAFLADRGHVVATPRLPAHATSAVEMRRTLLHEYLAAAELNFRSALELERGPIFVGGLSFGSLIALYLAVTYPSAVKGLGLMSCSLRFRSVITECVLRIFSRFPEALLSHLPFVKKTGRAPDALALPRESYPVHAIGAAARLVKLRRYVLRRAAALKMPVLLLQDPNDHHLSPAGVDALRILVPHLQDHWLAGAEHEMTVGHLRHQVFDLIARFVEHSGEETDAA